jgi:hypothetical protein
MRDRRLGYPAAANVEDALRRLLDHPKLGMQPNILLTAPPRNGKTTIRRRLQQGAYADTPRDSGIPIMPIVPVDMPSNVKEKDFWGALIYRVLGHVPNRAQTYSLKAQALDLLGYVECKVLFIDEFQHLMNGSAREKKQMLGLVKTLSNELDIPLFCAGTPEARHVLLEDKAMAGRFGFFDLPLWEMNDNLRRLLRNFELTLPFPKPSNLASDENANLLLARSDGQLGWIWQRIQAAAIRAIEAGTPYIEPEMLADDRLPLFLHVELARRHATAFDEAA